MALPVGNEVTVAADVSDRAARLAGRIAVSDANFGFTTVVSAPVDGSGSSASAFWTYAELGLFNGLTWDRARTPSKFFTASLTAAGSNAVWTPTVGKKFRLMGYILEVTANASLAAGAINTFSWLDAAGAIGLAHSDFEPTTAVTTGLVGYTTGMISLGNGYLSTVANNVLNLSIGTALATGVVRVNVWGTEE